MGIRTGNPRGRPKGSANKRTVARDARLAVVEKKLASVIPGLFEGDSHALLMSVYKNPAMEWSARIDAAKAAIRFEKPSLSAVETSGDIVRRKMSDLSDTELEERKKALLELAVKGGNIRLLRA